MSTEFPSLPSSSLPALPLSGVAAEHLSLLAQPRDLDGDELARFWRTLFRAEEDRIATTWESRLTCAWRLCRELARLKGMLEDPERFALRNATRMSPDPWTEPTGYFGLVEPTDSLVIAIAEARLPLLPHALDESQRERWLELVEIIAGRLGISLSEAGREALPLLLSARLALAAWPVPDQILDYEMLVISRVLKRLVEASSQTVHEELIQQGYRAFEASAVLELAKQAAVVSAGHDASLERAMMILRLQSAAERARDAHQPREEVAALRLLASVQGLVKNGGTGADGNPDADDRAMGAFARGLPPPPVSRTTKD